jgi:hypothetical protein
VWLILGVLWQVEEELFFKMKNQGSYSQMDEDVNNNHLKSLVGKTLLFDCSS